MTRLTILEADQVRPELAEHYGGYPGMFEALLLEAGADFEIHCVDVRKTLPEQIDSDIYLITGSRHSVYEPLDWIAPLASFIAEVLAAEKKVMGICFGHQLMAHFFGGEVSPSKQGWAVGVHTSRPMIEADWMQPAAQQISLLASHQDQVSALPENAEVYLGNDFCPVGGMIIGDHAITIQGHPEFSPEYMQSLMEGRRERIGKKVVEAAVASLSQPTDELTLFRWMLNFCLK